MTKNNILRRQWELLVETCELPEARENLNDQGAIGCERDAVILTNHIAK